MLNGLAAKTALISLCIFAVATSVRGAVTFKVLGNLPSDFPGGSAYGISGDGSTVVGWDEILTGGSDQDLPAEWTASGPSEIAGSGNGGTAYSASADGSVISGAMEILQSGVPVSRAFRWTQATGMVSLGLPSGSVTEYSSSGTAVSSDGSTVVGFARTQSTSTNEAIRWTAATGMVPLGYFGSAANASSAAGVSSDGSVIVGTAFDSTGTNLPFRWTQSAGMQSLLTLTPGSGLFSGNANAISSDGTTIVGTTISTVAGNPFNGANNAYKWTQAAGFVSLGFGTPDAISADSSVVVGEGKDGIANPDSEAVYWNAADQEINIADLLTSQGINLSGLQLENATGVSSDGATIVGYGNDNGQSFAWEVTVPEPAGCGLIALAIPTIMCRPRQRNVVK